MTNKRPVATVYLLVLGTAAAGFGADEKPITPTETIRLFDGTDLSAFDTWLADSGRDDPNHVFTIARSLHDPPFIRLSGNGYGGLITKDRYANYRLVVEYRWGDATWGDREAKARDSGILLHGQGEPGNFSRDFTSPWMQSIEYQIIEGGVGDILLLAGWTRTGHSRPTFLQARTSADRDGETVFTPKAEVREHLTVSGATRINWWGRDPDWADKLDTRGAVDLDSRDDAWTTLEAHCDGGDVRFFVNGTLANEGFASNLTSGKLLFQTEGAEIHFRRIDLEPLPRRQTVRAAPAPDRQFSAGAAAIDITPERLPIRTNGSMTQRLATKAIDRLHTRSVVLDDGATQVSMTVVDSCMMPRDMLDDVKRIASARTGIPADRMLISSTHTHTAPAVMGVHGTDPEPEYRAWLEQRIVEGIAAAHRNLAPARIGWAVRECPEFVFCRRWLMAPGTARGTPFSGHENDQAQMNPGNTNPNRIRNLGPADPDVTVLSVQTREGEPLALLANYSTHYAGSSQVSADYFGEFALLMSGLVGAGNPDKPFVALMSNGTSGDANCIDFTQKKRRRFTHHDVAQSVAKAAYAAYRSIKYTDWVPIDMREEKLTLDVRMPTESEVDKAQAYLDEYVKGQPVRNVTENYARETVLLSKMPPTRDLRLQALRLGDLAITGIPCEVYGITGLTIKGRSPFATTMNISLANGGASYIPPPAHFELGGYTTWRARTSCLEIDAEPKIRRTILDLLDQLARGRPASPLSPEQALDSFQSEPGLRVDLAAAEPDIVDPVAMAFDKHGRLYVVEGRGYPVDPDRGSIALLEDTDGDGRFKRRSTFAEGLHFPNGVLPYKDGVFVTDAPDLLYLKDTDGDGRADTREVVLTGFATDKSTQLRVNDPTLGLEGWVYLAGGLSGGRVSSPRHPDAPVVDLRRADLRFHPETGAFEAVDGKSQFGHSFDDFGRRFICMNRVQAQHVVLASGYLRRNPYLAFSDTVQDLPEERIDDLLRGQNAAARIYPISDNLTTADSHAGTFSAACAVTIWRGGALPGRYDGHVLSCDPTGNLIHHDRLVARGATFSARRTPEPVELLASTDNWFRPVFLADGPDGALYVCDMYREIIEHPDYLPVEVRKYTDFTRGRDRGRIYRAVRESPPRRPTRFAKRASLDALIDAMADENAWARDTAFRLLLERNHPDTSPAVRTHLGPDSSAPAKVMALHMLNNRGDLEPSDLMTALRSNDAGVRETAVKLAEPRLADSSPLADAVLELADDPDPRVRFRCALALGFVRTDEVLHTLEAVARRSGDDRWTHAAVISSADSREVPLLERFLDLPLRGPDTGLMPFLRDLSRAASRRLATEPRHALIARVIATDCGEDAVWPMVVLNGLMRGGSSSKAALREASIARHLPTLRERAARFATDERRPSSIRSAALELLATAGADNHIEALVHVMASEAPRALRLAAVRALAGTPGDSALAAFPPARWVACAPPIREALCRAFLPRPEFAVAFIHEIEGGGATSASLSPATRKRLLEHANETVRTKARRILDAVDGDRMKVFAAVKESLALRGVAHRGRTVFNEFCATCHRLDRQGVNVGPDLFGIRNQTKEAILLHIIVPNREVTPGFEAYVVRTGDGEIINGLIISETATTITVRENGGAEHALLRDDIDAMVPATVSLMPDGLESSINLQAMADLLAYLKGER